MLGYAESESEPRYRAILLLAEIYRPIAASRYANVFTFTSC